MGKQINMKKNLVKLFGSTFYRIERYLTNRHHRLQHEYLKLKMQKCGNLVRFYGKTIITNPDKVKIGDNVHINKNAHLNSGGGIEIGNNIHIGMNLMVYSRSHNYNGKRIPYDCSYVDKKVKIKDNVWIGANVTIVPGVTIGEGSIIGMGTVVSKDIPPLSIVGSVAPKILKYRDKEKYYKLKKRKEFGGIGGRPL